LVNLFVSDTGSLFATGLVISSLSSSSKIFISSLFSSSSSSLIKYLLFSTTVESNLFKSFLLGLYDCPG